MWTQIALVGLLVSFLPIWRGGKYSRKNGVSFWEVMINMAVRARGEYYETHLPVDEAVARAREAYLIC